MDYLDPVKKRQKKNRLMVMYTLLAIAIGIATLVMVYLVNGYSIDRQTGEVIQNGLIYVDTKPESADIYLNGEKQKGRTDARLVVPEGTYSVELKRDGYRDWKRDFILEGASLRRLTYARLVPNIIETSKVLDLPGTPVMVTQSNDKRWLIISYSDSPLRMSVIDLGRPVLQLIDLQLPAGLVTTTSTPGIWSTEEWADDNKTALMSYTSSAGKEFVLINRESGELAKSVKAIFPGAVYDNVALRSRKADSLYLFNSTTSSVSRANVGDGSLELVLNNVKAFKAYGDDAFVYVTDVDASEGLSKAIFRQGTQEYKLRDIKRGDVYLLDISKLGNAMIMGVGSKVEGKIYVYNDPINALKQNDFSTLPVPTTVMKITDPEELKISADSSVILARGGQNFVSHEFEADRSYNFKTTLGVDAGSKLNWIDGQHLLVSENGTQWMMDFDGSNQYELTSSLSNLPAYFDSKIDHFFTFKVPAEGATTYQMLQGFMRTAADR